jgi:hypothetical protein
VSGSHSVALKAAHGAPVYLASRDSVSTSQVPLGITQCALTALNGPGGVVSKQEGPPATRELLPLGRRLGRKTLTEGLYAPNRWVSHPAVGDAA